MRNLIYNIKYKYAVKHSDLIIAISEQTKKDIIEFYKIDPDKIKVVYQSCHKNFRKNHLPEELKTVKEKFNLPREFLLNVGTIETRKNLISVINAMDLMKIDIPLVVVGKKTAYMNFLKIQIKKELEENYMVIAEGIQTRMKVLGINNSYEKLKEITRINDNKDTKTKLKDFINECHYFDDSEKDNLNKLTPFNYTGEYDC